MDSVDKWKPFFFRKMSDGLVGGDHKFFNDLMCQASLRPDDMLDLPLEIEDDLGLWKIKIKSPPSRPSLAKFLTEIGHEF